MTEELAEVYRDYCQEVWIEALNLARLPAASKWRKAKNVYYPSNLQEASMALLGSKVDATVATTAPK